MPIIQIALAALFIVLAVRLIMFVAKNQRIPILIKENEPFTVRYSPAFLLAAVLFFMVFGGLVLWNFVWQNINLLSIILMCILGVIGLFMLLLSLVFKIQVFPEYLIYTNIFRVKKQIYYKDIKEVHVFKHGIIMRTTLKRYQFSSYLIYRENLLKRLSENRVKVKRIS